MNSQDMRGHGVSRAFALPTVLIASVVLLMVLAVSVTATTAVRASLKGQYYAQLAQTAGDAGVVFAQACLAANGNVAQWTDAKPLTPATDCYGDPINGSTVRVLVVGGGGGGGGSGASGGGGAGGVLHDTAKPVVTQTYPVTVGAGGAGGVASTTGTNGSSSSFSDIVAYGGGAGSSVNGNDGASGGGSGRSASSTIIKGLGSQGFDGGTSGYYSGQYPASGGGGAGANGGSNASASPGTSGAGGAGVSNNITGSSVVYGGGGGGGGDYGCSRNLAPGAGGSGGGGAGGSSASPSGFAGTANTGGGGGGATQPSSCNNSAPNGGNGGSGVVIISYPTSGPITATGGTVTTSGGNTIHRFTSSGNFTVTANGSVSCPTDPQCFVSVNGNVKSSFRVGLPVPDVDGRAVTIPNSGYVQIFRTSTATVWRTYKQPTSRPVSVPDLCSGTTTGSGAGATGTLGWVNAVKATTQDSFAPTAHAQTITSNTGNTAAGSIFFRKDFYVQTPGVYRASVLVPPAANNDAVINVDGVNLATSTGELGAGTITLSQGCHTVMIKLTNGRIQTTANRTRVTAAIKSDTQQTPVISTDTSWRWDVGQQIHYSTSNFYADPALWTVARDVNSAAAMQTNWNGLTGDAFARWISTTHNNSSGNYPSSQYTYFRDSKDIIVTTPTQVRVSLACDDGAIVYLDGAQVINSNSNFSCSGIRSIMLMLTPGKHRFGAMLFNSSGASALSIAVVRISDGAALTYTDDTWRAVNYWSTSLSELYSYDKTFVPTPNQIATTPTATALIIAGGGGGGNNGGGGGGAGGVIYLDDLPLTVGSYPVTIGAGGAGAASNSVTGSRGGNTSLAGFYTANGGGGGASRDGGGAALSGGSGGGGAGSPVPQSSAGIATSSGAQGNAGGAGYDNTCGSAGGGGGGFGGAGSVPANYAGANGGAGLITYITGTLRIFAGGGAGSFTCAPGTAGSANGGGGSGSGAAGAANTGGGGAGGNGGTVVTGGAGGSGVIIITYPTGSMTATGGTITYANGYTIHTFNATSGTGLVVTAVN